ncbi:unnamed protein product [Urochloa decumbens]|uniref:UDP-glycosyltransferases domain-containing protein n=1 Tax=Urochloa decumbens TaxID=240449 RepID=A0ABC8XJR5_9POAL
MTTGADGAGSSSTSSRRRMHVVIFPWLAFGHLLPGLELAQRLASRGHRVSFVSTPRNLARLPPLPPALAPRVDLVALPLPRLEEDGFPDGAESTNDVPFGAFELHRKAFDGLAAPFAAFLDAACAQGVGNGRPDWVVLDNFHHWAAAAAVDRKSTEDDATLQWLDGQPAKSVVYVALGTEAPLRVELLCELAHGLELAGTRFLWALRLPSGAGEGSIVPGGFAERTGERGLVTTRWVPQVSVLAHGAVCAFLTHCGWGSIVEGLRFGHPLIMLPLFGDQGPNARLMEARQVGVPVPRDEKDGSFDREGVAAAVRTVVVEEEGRVFAANARKLQEIVADKGVPREVHRRVYSALKIL